MQRVQAAIETTRGTEVTTMTRELVVLQQGGATMTYTADREDAPETVRSFAADRDTQITNRGATFAVEAKLSYEEAPWWFQLGINGAASLSGVTDGGTPPAYTYENDPVDTSDTLDTATIKYGDAAICYVMKRWAVTEMGLRCNPNAGGEASWRLTATGPAIFVGTDTFDTPTETNRTIVQSSGSKLYLDTSSAIGTTQLVGLVRNFSITITNNIEEKRFVEDGADASSDFGRGAQRITGDFTLELLDDTYFALMRANTAVKLRFEQEGSQIHGTPATPYLFQVDLPQVRLNAPSFSYAGNNKVITVPFVAEKPVGAAAIQTTTVNAIATVPA